MIALPRSTYYRRPVEEPASVAEGAPDGDQGLVDAITAIRRAHPAYGYRRVTAALRREGQCVNKKRVQRLMRLGVAPAPPRRASWRVADDEPTTGAWYPNRRADMTPTGPDQLWVADLTYLKVGRESAFLAVLLDAWLRRVIGYALGPLLDARLPLAALEAALESRRPAPGCVHHSDRGTQYASRLYRERLASAGLVGSMSRAGNPYDNAHIESFMKTLKHEEFYLKGYRTMADLSAALPTYLEEVYNGTRLHSALGYLPPAEYEQPHHLTRTALELPDFRGGCQSQAPQREESPVPAKLRTDRVRRTYEFIRTHRKQFPVEVMCRQLGVAPSGYYQWVKCPQSARAVEDARLLRLIRASFKASQGIYGAPRVFLDLREAGETCSKHRVARLMRENGLRALHGYRTRRWEVGKPAVLTPNLLKRQFSPTKRNAAWATDITSIRTWQGWLYLAVVIDLFSRKVVGWAAGPTIHRELVLDALASAVQQRRPRGTIIHSDQGVQFGSDAWRRFCRANHLEPSMSRKGNCWDNAVVESFFSSLKKERIKKRIYTSRDAALADIADYIDTFYNRTRRHSHLGGISPEEFEATHKRGRSRVAS